MKALTCGGMYSGAGRCLAFLIRLLLLLLLLTLKEEDAEEEEEEEDKWWRCFRLLRITDLPREEEDAKEEEEEVEEDAGVDLMTPANLEELVEPVLVEP